MNPPDSIPFSSIDLGSRGRQAYTRIDELAESIEQNGLIQPIVLVPTQADFDIGAIDMRYSLLAGGRRYHALKLLNTETLYHATTSDPLRPGFILRGEADPFTHLLGEIAENLDRQDLDWRDETALIVKAWRLAKASADESGEYILMRNFGSMLGCGYAKLQAAEYIYTDVIANPERYKDVTSVRGAQSVLFKVNANALAKLAAEKGLTELAPLGKMGSPLPLVSARPEPRLDAAGGERTQNVATVSDAIAHPTIPLTQSFICADAIAFMAQCAPETFDHIVTDPDYALSVDRLSANSTNMEAGVAQDSIEASLMDLQSFLALAFKVVKPFGFCIFWYDLDHHEKLQRYAVAAGWSVQRWPLTWRKLDYRSNASPGHNTCKNVEWAMICRKPDAVLAQVQMSSIYDTYTGKVTKELGHPFAKPYDLWKWLFSMISIKGQTIFDPFAGSGSCPIAALQYGLRPMGCEVNETHYHNLMCNLQLEYKKLLGPDIKFS